MKDCKFFNIINNMYYCEYDNSKCICIGTCENYVKEGDLNN